MSNLKTVGYIDLNSRNPKIYNKGQYRLVKETRTAAEQARKEAFFKEATKRAYAILDQINARYMSEKVEQLQSKYSKHV